MTFTGGNDPRDIERRRESQERYRPVTCKYLVTVHVTDKALLVIEGEESGGNNPRKIWIPISQIVRSTPAINTLERDDEVEVTLPKWLADEKELLYDD